MAYNIDSPEHRLRLAAKAGDIETVRTLLDEGADINAAPGTLTALVLAMHQHDLDMVNLLLQRGAIPNRKAWHEAPAKMVALFFRYGATLTLTPPEQAAFDRKEVRQVLPDSIKPKDRELLDLLATWRAVDPEIIGNDEIWVFTSPQEDWDNFAGRSGYFILHEVKPVKIVVTFLN